MGFHEDRASSLHQEHGGHRKRQLSHLQPSWGSWGSPGKHSLASYSNTSRPRRKEEIETECLPCLRSCGYSNTRYSAASSPAPRALHVSSHLLFTAMTKVPTMQMETQRCPKVLQVWDHKPRFKPGEEAFTRLHCCICYRAGILATGLPRVVHLEGVETR